jgi:predicted RNase H-like HicB family nuclease
MVEEVVKTYHVTYERDESGWWVASVRELRGCHTQGRTVDEARRRIVEAMELFIDNARSAKIVADLKLPAAAKKAIRAYSTLRKRAEQQERRAALAARRAVRVLRGGRLKMSARDAARVLGLSHQRVHPRWTPKTGH